MSTAVVYVHGLWFTGREALLLRHRLARDLAAEDRVFAYHSVTATVSDNAAALGRFLATLKVDTLHLVGHSMGGLVILRLFENPPPLAPGRIVLLGPPLNGSQAACTMARLPFGKALLGRGIEEEVLNARGRRWDRARDLGIIAGDMPFGLGHLIHRYDRPSDGTVLVEETRLEGASAHLVMHVTHSGLLVSAAVVRQTATFLRSGRFAP